MSKTSRRRALLSAAAFLLFASCATAQSFELERVQRSDVKVLPGSEGFVHPLTGVVSYAPQDWQERPVLGIKIGNSVHERPQSGLDRADVVYEEIVEGGVTRFLAVFSTNEASRVGPVRSARSVDARIMQPLGGLFAYSGAVDPVVAEVRSTPGLVDVGANSSSDAYRRDDSRDAPYNLYATTEELWSGRSGGPPEPRFEFLETDEDPTAGGDQAANNVSFAFANNSAELRYSYNEDTGRYERFNGDTPHIVEGNGDGARLSFPNVLVQMVDVSAGSTVDRAGERSSEISMVGGGAAALFRGGRVFRGRWERGGPGETTRFISTSGEPLRLVPGTTLIELLPEGRELTVT